MGVRRVSSIFFGLSLSIVYIYLANAQSQSCPPITIGDLGSTSEFSSEGLVPLGIVTALTTGETVPSVPVRIMNYTIVCDASGNRKDTSSYVSVVVQFQCNVPGGTGTLSVCDGSTMVTRQYQFQCIDDNGQVNWAASVSRSTTHVQTLNPAATLSTPLADQCRRCIDDQQVLDRPSVNDTTHCDACDSRCNQGLRRCFVSSPRDACCNFYLQGDCVAQCPSALVANSDFDCVCPLLSLANGNVIYTPTNRDIGSVATYNCTSGYRLSPQGGATQNCTRNGWNGQDVTCEFIRCPDLIIENGQVTVNPSDQGLNSRATYVCNPGYGLVGNGDRMCREDSTWSGEDPKCNDCRPALQDPNCETCGFDSNGNAICTQCKPGYTAKNGKCEKEGETGASSSSCDTGCIIGIVLAILGAIILSLVVAAVVYAVYRYLSNPATKLAKAGTEGLNGVARDNPLYLPPEEIVGDVGDVETA